MIGIKIRVVLGGLDGVVQPGEMVAGDGERDPGMLAKCAARRRSARGIWWCGRCGDDMTTKGSRAWLELSRSRGWTKLSIPLCGIPIMVSVLCLMLVTCGKGRPGPVMVAAPTLEGEHVLREESLDIRSLARREAELLDGFRAGDHSPSTVHELSALYLGFKRPADALRFNAAGLSADPDAAGLWTDRAALLAGLAESQPQQMVEAYLALQRVPPDKRSVAWSLTAIWLYGRFGLSRMRGHAQQSLQRIHPDAVVETVGDLAAFDPRAFLRQLENLDEGAVSRALRERPQAVRECIEDAWLTGLPVESDPESLMQMEMLRDLAVAANPRSIFAATMQWCVLNRDQLNGLGDGFRAYAQGRRDYESQRIDRARSEFEAALGAFERAGCPLRHLCLTALGICDFYDGLPERLTPEQLSAMEPFPEVQARLHWMRGLRSARANLSSTARTHFLRALAYAEACGERETIASLHSMLAMLDRGVGDFPSSWRNQLAALEVAPVIARDRSRYKIYKCAIELAVLQGEPTLASALADQFSQTIVEPVAPGVVLASLVDRGRLAYETNDPQGCRRAVDAIRANLNAVAKRGIRMHYRAEADLLEALLNVQSDVSRAQSMLDRAAAGFKSQDNQLRLFETSITAVRIQLSAGDMAAARSQLLELKAILDRRRAGLGWQRLRTLKSLGSQLAEDWMERAPGAAVGPLMEMLDICQLRDGAFARESGGPWIRYFVGPNYCWRFEFRAGQSSCAKLNMGTRALSELVRNASFGLAGGHDDLDTWDRLGAVLLPPWDDPPDRLQVAPDGCLWNLPFSALKHGESRLGQTVELALVETPTEMRPSGRADVVLVPGYAGAVPNLGLEALPSVRDEVQALATLGKGAAVIPRFSLERARQTLAHASGWHYAGHAVVWQGRGALVVEGPAGSPTLLGASDLETIDLSGLDWIVLSSCRSGRREGDASLVEACLRAGAGSVLASMRVVADGEVSAFMVALHGQLRRGLRLERAARLARSESDDPSDWIGFEVYR